MRKIIIYLIIALFLVSVVPAEPTITSIRDKPAVTTRNFAAAKNTATETPEECLARLSEISPDASEESLKKRCALKKVTTKRLKTARKITKAKLTIAKENYQNAKKRYQTARENYLTAQNKFKDAKKKIEACKDQDTDECSQLRDQIRERARESLLKTADRILEHLNKIKAKVDSSEDLSDEEAAEILKKIDEMIQEIEDAKSTIETSEDKDEILEAAKTIKQSWVRIKKRLAIHTGRIVNARIGGIIVRVKQLETKLEKILDRMEDKGIDTSEVQSLVDEFNVKIEEAQSNYESALDKFKEAVSAEDVETAHELAKEGHRYMKAAHESLKEAQKLLRDIVRSIKQSGGQQDLTAVAEEDEEETDDDEVDEEDETDEEDDEDERDEEDDTDDDEAED